MAKAIGIDFGATYSTAAYVNEYGSPTAVKNADGHYATPSVVLAIPPHYVVGEAALQSTITEPNRVIQSMKQFIGATDYYVQIDEQRLSPEFISSVILRKLAQDAADETREQIDAAVIAVPVNFTEEQRQAVREIGTMADLNVLDIIDEPTAAILSYGVSRRGQFRNIIVYDLGGSSLDITIAEVDGEALNIIGVGGDPHFGGKNWDDCIIEFIEEELRNKFSYDMQFDAALEAEIQLKAEAAKWQLSTRPSVPITIKIRRVIDGAETFTSVRIELTRENFEIMTSDLLDRTKMALEDVMNETGLNWDDISETLCVGGGSNMPAVRKMLSQLTNNPPLVHAPSERIAKGAALQAAALAQDDTINIQEL